MKSTNLPGANRRAMLEQYAHINSVQLSTIKPPGPDRPSVTKVTTRTSVRGPLGAHAVAISSVKVG